MTRGRAGKDKAARGGPQERGGDKERRGDKADRGGKERRGGKADRGVRRTGVTRGPGNEHTFRPWRQAARAD